MMVFGGMLLPVNLMPEKLITCIKFTPLPYVFNLPAKVLFGNFSLEELFFQIFWVIGLGLIFNIMYRYLIYRNIEVLS